MIDLTPQELQEPRTAAQLLPWVEQKIKKIGSTENGKRAIRFREGLAKPLVEEALPLGIFASRHFHNSEEVTVVPTLGSQNYDARIQDKREERARFSFIEITQAHEGENEHLRMIALDRDGHVSPLGAVRKSGTKATGIQVEIESVAVSHSAVLEQEIRRVEQAIRRKMGKSYPDETILLVVFDDFISMHDEADLERLRGCIRPLLSDLSNFRWLAVIGWSKRTFEEFDLASFAS